MHYDKFYMDLKESILSGLIQNVLIILIIFSKGRDETRQLRAVKEKCSLSVRKVKDKNFAELTLRKQHNWDFPLRRFNIHNAVKFPNKWLELSFCFTTLFKIVCCADLE